MSQEFDKAKADAVERYGAERVTVLAGHGGIVCGPARGQDFARFTQGLTRAVTDKGGTVWDAERRLVLSALKFPGADAVNEIFDEYPGLVETLANAIQARSGAAETVEGN